MIVDEHVAHMSGARDSTAMVELWWVGAIFRFYWQFRNCETCVRVCLYLSLPTYLLKQRQVGSEVPVIAGPIPNHYL